MNKTQIWCALLAFSALAPAFAKDEAEADDFEVPGAAIDEFANDLVLQDMALTGNPGRSMFAWWPEDLVVAPIPAMSPQLGWNLTLGAAYFLEGNDEDSDVAPSVLGGFVMGAENGSYAYGAGASLHLLDDKLRIKGGGGYADIRYQYYGIGNDQGRLGQGLFIEQNGPLYFASASWRVWKSVYVGLGYLGGTVDSRIRYVPPDLPYFDPTLSLDVGAIHIPLEIDTRDQEQFPMNGWLASVKAMLYRKSVGSDFDADILKASVNHYRTVREHDVLATRVAFRMASEGAPFFLLSTFGGSTDLRGYPSGRYRDRMMYAMQTEYRWHVKNRWILTGFVGFGEVAEELSGFGENFLPAAGVGARFVISEKHRVSLSADLATGKHGTEFYFGVGEAF